MFIESVITEEQFIDLNDRIAEATSQWVKDTGKEVCWDLVPQWNEEEGILSYKVDILL